MSRLALLLSVVLIALFASPRVAAAVDNHPELAWKVFDTEHFRFYYYDGVTQTASFIAEVAEKVYPQLAEKYDYDLPTPIRVVLDDTSDPLNGAAYTDLNLMELEGLSSVTEFRGVHDWMRDVFTHELAHLFSLRKTQMFGDLVPGIVVSGLDAPPDRPFQVAATLFIPNDVTPRWFAEGIAQFDSTELGYDRWDSHRDMLLRMAVLENGVFSLTEMGALSDKNYLEAEKVYNHGFDFLRYLGARHSPGLVRDIPERAGNSFTWNFLKPMGDVLHGDPVTYHAAWEADRKTRYYRWLRDWAGELYEGDFVIERGFLTRRAAVSPDGRYLAFTANGKADFSRGELYLHEFSGGETKIIFTGVGSQPAWLPDSSGMIVSSDANVNLSGYSVNDLYLVTVKGDTKQLTSGVRAESPGVSLDGKWIAATVADNGARNLHVWPFDPSATDGEQLGEPKKLTHFRPGIEAVQPRFSPDGRALLFSVNVGQSADLWRVGITDSTITPLTQGPQEEVEAFYLNADTILYVADDRAAFDVYALSITNRTRKRLTTTLGGAFSPSTDATHLYFALYHDEAFALHRRQLDGPAIVTAPSLPPVNQGLFEADLANMTTLPNAPENGRAYIFDPLPIKFYPEFLYSDRAARAGGSLVWGDVLNKHEMEFEFLLGENQDYHAVYQNHQFVPDLLFDLSRYIRRDRVVDDVISQKIDFQYDTALAGAIITYGYHMGFVVTAAYKRVDFGYPVDRVLLEGSEAAGEWNFVDLAPNVSSDINPTGGRAASLRAAKSWTRFFSTTGSVLDGVYTKEQAWSFTGNYREYISLPGDSTLEAGIMGGYLSKDVNPIDELFLGGRLFFLRQGEFQSDRSFPGYEGFSLAGEKLLLGSLAFRFPLWRGHAKAGPATLDSVYLQTFGNAGNVLAFDQPWRDFLGPAEVHCPVLLESCDLKAARTTGLFKDAGLELRVKTLLFDAYPWNSFVRVAYGFDEPVVKDRVRAYLGLGIGFN